MKKVLLRIHGRVQGVGYRMWAMDAAKRRGLKGWVRNCRDGTVEVLLAGAEANVADMLAACRLGPPVAEVTEIEVQETDAKVGDGFEERATV